MTIRMFYIADFDVEKFNNLDDLARYNDEVTFYTSHLLVVGERYYSVELTVEDIGEKLWEDLDTKNMRSFFISFKKFKRKLDFKLFQIPRAICVYSQEKGQVYFIATEHDIAEPNEGVKIPHIQHLINSNSSASKYRSIVKYALSDAYTVIPNINEDDNKCEFNLMYSDITQEFTISYSFEDCKVENALEDLDDPLLLADNIPNILEIFDKLIKEKLNVFMKINKNFNISKINANQLAKLESFHHGLVF